MNIQNFLNAVLKQDAECLFSAAEIARLKNTVSLPCGKRHGLYKRVPRTNTTVFEN